MSSSAFLRALSGKRVGNTQWGSCESLKLSCLMPDLRRTRYESLLLVTWNDLQLCLHHILYSGQTSFNPCSLIADVTDPVPLPQDFLRDGSGSWGSDPAVGTVHRS